MLLLKAFKMFEIHVHNVKATLYMYIVHVFLKSENFPVIALAVHVWAYLIERIL